MTLGFSTHIDGKPTYFIEKIWAGLTPNSGEEKILFDHIVNYSKYILKLKDEQSLLYNKLYFEYETNGIKRFEPIGFGEKKLFGKIHTIREDSGIDWKKDMNIHFAIKNRTKNRFQFAPVVQVKSIQRIIIDYSISETEFPFIGINRTLGEWRQLNPNNHFEYITELQELAQNDGFDTWEDFLKYFNKDFKGKIIHWTDLRY